MAYEKGGRADKNGNRFEINWTIRKILDILDEKIQSITIEALGDDEKGVDLWVVSKDGSRECQQCKGRNGSKEKWDYGSLNSRSIWSNWSKQLSRSDDITVSMVSPLSFTLLEDLSERARTNNNNAKDFYEHQVKGTEMVSLFNNACCAMNIDYSSETGLERALDFFSRMRIRQIPDSEMKEEILARIHLLFIGNPEDTYRVLLDYVFNTDVHGNELNIATVNIFLSKNGVEYRNLARDERIWPTIAKLNSEYNSIFRPFSCGYIDRDEASTCKSLIENGESIIIHGNAGIGKSGCTENLVRTMEEEKVPYLAVKLDWHIPSGNSESWALKLGLPASISHCMHAITPDKNGVIILDQLDALRWTQAHSGEALSICKQIIQEIRQINKERSQKLSLVFVCRTYDLNNDTYISSLFSDEEWHKVQVGPLSDSELKRVLGSKYNNISNRTKKLLSIPSNLYIWERLDNNKVYREMGATHQLVREWWKQLTRNCHDKNLDSNTIQKIKKDLVSYCYKNSKLNMPCLLLDMPGDYEEYLVSAGFIVVERNTVSFIHQSILDCFFAEEMIKGYLDSKDIKSIVGEKKKQTPAKRYQTVIFFQQLAELSEQDFVLAGRQLLDDRDIRYSFKYIFIEVLAQLSYEFEEIQKCVISLIMDSKWKETVISSVVMGSVQYIHCLRNLGYVEDMLKTDTEQRRCIDLFYSIKDNLDDKDVELIRKYITDDNIGEFRFIFSRDISSDTDDFFNFRMEVYDKYPDLLNDFFDVKKMMQKCEKRTILLLSKMVKEKIKKNGDSLYRYADEFVCEDMDLFVHNYKYVLDNLLAVFPDLNTDVRYMGWSARYGFHNGLERTCVLLVKIASRAFASNDPDGFIDYYKFAYDKGSSIYNEVILDAMFQLDESYADYVIEYLSKKSFINSFEDTSNSGNKLSAAKKLIERFTECCSEDAISLLEDRLLHFNDLNAVEHLRRRIEINKEQKKKGERRVYWSFWGDLQLELIPAINPERRSKELNELLRVLQHKFENSIGLYDYEQDGRACSVISPVAGKKLSANNWMKIISNSAIDIHGKTIWKQKEGICIENSISEFAASFSKFVSDNPHEASEILLQAKDVKIKSAFIDSYFSGLSLSNKIENLSDRLVAEAIRYFGYDYDSYRASSIADAIGKLTIDTEEKYLVDVLFDIALNHNNPKDGEQVVISYKDEEGTTVESIESNAINCTRGRAITALSDLLWKNKDIYYQNKDKINQLLNIENIYIKYATLYLLWPIYNYDREWATGAILNIYKSDYRILGFYDSRQMLCLCYENNTQLINSLLTEAFNSDDDRLIRISGATIVELYLIKGAFGDIYDLYSQYDKRHRKAMLEMLIVYFNVEKFREKTKEILNRIIKIEDDSDNEFLWGRLFIDKLVDPEQDKELIELILCSKIKKSIIGHFSDYIMEKKQLKNYTDAIFELCTSILEKPNDIKYTWGVDTEVLKLILALYDETVDSALTEDDVIAQRCLDIWDLMYEKNIGMARHLTEQLLNPS